MFTLRKTAAYVLTTVVAASTLLSASAASTGKSLSSNFTLVNLIDGANNGTIQYVLPNGTPWKATNDTFTLTGVGAQVIYRQYSDAALGQGSGSVVVSTDGPVGAVVQIQARGQTPTSGAYIGVSEGAATANVPLVSRRGDSLSGKTNSQIIMQNASSTAIDIHLSVISSATGAEVFQKTFPSVAANASVEFDLDDDVSDAEVPPGFFGSATVSSATAGGEVAVVSNFFTGGDAMQTFNAFTQSGTKWFAPLFTSRLANNLSTPIAVQNVSGATIPIGGITLTCTKNPNSPGPTNDHHKQYQEVLNTASYFFNPAPAEAAAIYPAGWYGSCKVDSGAANTAMFVQMRFVNPLTDPNQRAGAYEGILATGTNKRVVVPLIAKRLANTFASAVTVQNLNEGAVNNVTLAYKGAIDGQPANTAPCTKSFTDVIPAGGSIIHNHRVPLGQANAVDIADLCVGSLTVTGDQPLDAFVQLDFTGQQGDAFMAHDAFPIAAAQ